MIGFFPWRLLRGDLTRERRIRRAPRDQGRLCLTNGRQRFVMSWRVDLYGKGRLGLPPRRADRAATLGKKPVIAGITAALALSASATPAPNPQAPAVQANPIDPIGELIDKAKRVADEAVTAVET